MHNDFETDLKNRMRLDDSVAEVLAYLRQRAAKEQETT